MITMPLQRFDQDLQICTVGYQLDFQIIFLFSEKNHRVRNSKNIRYVTDKVFSNQEFGGRKTDSLYN